MGPISTNETRRSFLSFQVFKFSTRSKRKMMRGILCVLVLAVLIWVSNARSRKRAMDSGTQILQTKYKIVSAEVWWAKAKQECESLGMTLATPMTKEELRILGLKITDSQNYWVGATCETCTSTKVDDDRWTWLEGEPLHLRHPNWDSGLPTDTNGDAKCLDIKKKNGKIVYINHKCERTNGFGYICQKSYLSEPIQM